jgi:hypothetical protein
MRRSGYQNRFAEKPGYHELLLVRRALYRGRGYTTIEPDMKRRYLSSSYFAAAALAALSCAPAASGGAIMLMT